MSTTAGPASIGHIAALVCEERPEWDHYVVTSVLQSHAAQVDAPDLAVAAIRAAANRDLLTPKAIGFRGRHWDGLSTRPVEQRAQVRCDVCGKPESRCWTERPGPDDHPFTPPA